MVKNFKISKSFFCFIRHHYGAEGSDLLHKDRKIAEKDKKMLQILFREERQF